MIVYVVLGVSYDYQEILLITSDKNIAQRKRSHCGKNSRLFLYRFV